MIAKFTFHPHTSCLAEYTVTRDRICIIVFSIICESLTFDMPTFTDMCIGKMCVCESLMNIQYFRHEQEICYTYKMTALFNTFKLVNKENCRIWYSQLFASLEVCWCIKPLTFLNWICNLLTDDRLCYYYYYLCYTYIFCSYFFYIIFAH